MRRIRKVTAAEENFRVEPIPGFPPNWTHIRRDPVETEPVGTIVLMAFRVTGYDPDCDGSLMARLDQISMESLEETGMSTDSMGLYPTIGLVVSEVER